MCKANISGMKCDQCNNGNVLGPLGCLGNQTVFRVYTDGWQVIEPFYHLLCLCYIELFGNKMVSSCKLIFLTYFCSCSQILYTLCGH